MTSRHRAWPIIGEQPGKPRPPAHLVLTEPLQGAIVGDVSHSDFYDADGDRWRITDDLTTPIYDRLRAEQGAPMASANVGGTPGWKAMRGTCPVCKRDTALSPPAPPHKADFTVKAHGPLRARCKGTDRTIRREDTRFPTEPGKRTF